MAIVFLKGVRLSFLKGVRLSFAQNLRTAGHSLEGDPNSVRLVAVKDEAIAEVEVPAQVTEQPAAPVEEDIDNLF